jgi:hypothetical protein
MAEISNWSCDSFGERGAEDAGTSGSPELAVTIRAIKAEQRALMEALQSGQVHTGKELAEHLGWDPAKISNIKGKIIVKGTITERAWDACLKRDDDGMSDF